MSAQYNGVGDTVGSTVQRIISDFQGTMLASLAHVLKRDNTNADLIEHVALLSKNGYTIVALMSAYHSEFVPAPNTVGNMALLPLRTKFRGPAPMNPSLEKDIIDEALYLFKSLIFFRQYELKSEADRVLVYLVLYILECLRKLQKCPNRIVAGKELAAMAISRFDLPGDPDFPRELNNMYAKPKNSTELEAMRGYLTQLRQELGVRLIDKVYSDDNSPPNKDSVRKSDDRHA
uniref:Actin-related protein 2/3 complex subunit 3 n=1 Tax=Trichobilharzia regenti TaxID=157069 RepID=A0AA85JI79_TRIRE|nr:unnamed protein product [Trichobilharzia regenti]